MICQGFMPHEDADDMGSSMASVLSYIGAHCPPSTCEISANCMVAFQLRREAQEC